MRCTLWTVPLAALLAAPVQADWKDRLDCERLEDSSIKHCETIEDEWKATGRLVVSCSPNGGVAVVGWDRDVVHVKAHVHARGATEADAREIADQIRVSMTPERITATGPSGHGWSVTFVVHVPKRTDLDLRADNGPVGVEGVTGTMTLETRNGPISIDGAGGDVRALSLNGPLHVNLSGRVWAGKGLDAETRNGPVTLRVPERYSATLESGTRNGPMEIDLPVRIRRGQHFTTELGAGGRPVRVVTYNGPIQIRRT
jgi:DUF4097 and DUF4098 domain-containing protein YvlB